MKRKKKGKSIRWMATMLMLAVAVLGWMIAAGSYATDVEGWRPVRVRGVIGIFVIGGARFVYNSIAQVPNAHRVAAHTVTQHVGILVAIALLEIAVWLFSRWAAKLERQFAEEDKKYRRRSGDG
jgi:hypothetical protein